MNDDPKKNIPAADGRRERQGDETGARGSRRHPVFVESLWEAGLLMGAKK